MTSDPIFQIREAGDSALLVELEAIIDPDINARAIGLAAAMRQRALPGVRDVVSTFRSVAVFFDPLATDVRQVSAALQEESGSLPPRPESRLVEVPVTYGGAAGPDLLDVAAIAGCSPQEVIDRHTSRTYRVFMLGFLPGFAYLASVDDRIAAPRRASPRARVPAGSVGIAGRQTGIYPRESPGGWQIVGRTGVTVFDPAGMPPALFAPGDEVRFVPVGPDEVTSHKPHVTSHNAGVDRVPGGTTRFVTVLRPGLLTTVQDEGRWGYQSLGVSVTGPLDWVSHRAANALVGNPRDAATLEVTLVGPELRFEDETWIAIAGADLQPSLDGADVAMHTPVRCRAGTVLRFGERRCGARAYIGFDGGVAVPPVLGSRATHLLSALGGIDGRALKAGDRIPLGGAGTGVARAGLKAGPWIGLPASGPGRSRVAADAGLRVGPGPIRGARLRVLPGPQADQFDPSVFDLLQGSRYTISPQSDRVGYRLAGGARISGAPSGDMISDVAFGGGVQVPPAGQPILLMADRPTTGGYPQVAIVVTADLPLAAQLAPGDWVEFALCNPSDARAALAVQEETLR